MENVLLVISLICCIALIIAVLLQRSEGGALGMGGGPGGLVSGRGAADTLVRATMVLAAVFFVTCLALTRMASDRAKQASDVVRALESGDIESLTDPLDEAAPIVVEEPLEDNIPVDLFDGPEESPESDVGEMLTDAIGDGADTEATPESPE